LYEADPVATAETGSNWPGATARVGVGNVEPRASATTRAIGAAGRTREPSILLFPLEA